MQKMLMLLWVCLLTSWQATIAQKLPLSYYLPENKTYDSKIPTPEAFFGFQIGEQHLSHDQLVAYMYELDRLSDRISLKMIGRTFEYRPLLVLTITSPDNHANLEKIRLEHLKLSDPSVSASVNTTNMPVVLYQGHSIHGNEPSGANASVLAAYYWAAAQGNDVEEVLKNTVILFDPSFNPDGMQRFSQWVNMHRSKNLVSDPSAREFSEVWPYGRTNHYWFDLNRDWLVSQLPESQARIKVYHDWKPNVLTDHHEMGSNSTFFFQPGVPSRVNPYTPLKNQELTGKIAAFHAKALDKIGSQYYTKENFDDFYYGKGSTYPDVNGAIGILFEQASSRGHVQQTVNGPLTFAFTIRNQLTTSFSTVEAAQNLRAELLNYQRDFYKNSADEAKKEVKKAYVFGDKYDQSRLNRFIEMLQRSQIKVYKLNADVAGFDKNSSFIVPLEQQQYKLIKANFERYTEGKDGFFADSLFYDISSWTLPMAFNLNYKSLSVSEFNAGLLGKEWTPAEATKGEIVGKTSSYGYVFEYDDYFAPQLLNAVLQAGLTAKVATETFKVNTVANGLKSFNIGSIFIPVQNQKLSASALEAFLTQAVAKTGVKIAALETGLSAEGIDLGSPSLLNVKRPNVAMLVGEGVTNTDAGEVWHLLDQRYDMMLNMLDINNIGRMDLSKYSCLIVVDGSYGTAVASKIKEYLSKGGTVVAFGRATRFLKNNDLNPINFKDDTAGKTDVSKRRRFADVEEDNGSNVVGGAIFEAETDVTHPLLYGYRQDKMPLFRAEALFMELPQNAYAAPLIYTEKPLVSGYLSPKNKAMAPKSAALIVASVGSGRVISMIDNPCFRAFWYGTNKLMANMVLFGNLIPANTTESKN